MAARACPGAGPTAAPGASLTGESPLRPHVSRTAPSPDGDRIEEDIEELQAFFATQNESLLERFLPCAFGNPARPSWRCCRSLTSIFGAYEEVRTCAVRSESRRWFDGSRARAGARSAPASR